MWGLEKYGKVLVKTGTSSSTQAEIYGAYTLIKMMDEKWPGQQIRASGGICSLLMASCGTSSIQSSLKKSRSPIGMFIEMCCEVWFDFVPDIFARQSSDVNGYRIHLSSQGFTRHET